MTARELIDAFKAATNDEKQELCELLLSLPIFLSATISCDVGDSCVLGNYDTAISLIGSITAADVEPTDEPIVKEPTR